MSQQQPQPQQQPWPQQHQHQHQHQHHWSQPSPTPPQDADPVHRYEMPWPEDPVRLLIQGATPETERIDAQILLSALLTNQGIGYRVIDELVRYAALAPHVVAGQAITYPVNLGSMGLPAGHPWLRLPNIFLIETAAQSVTAVTGALYRLFADPNQPNLYIQAIEVETTLGISLSTKMGTGFNLADPTAMHGSYKNDIGWTNKNSAGASITGSGVTVAVLDTGSTTAFSGWHDFTSPPSATEVDTHGHGTAMATIINDLAPNADIHVMRVARNGTLGLFDLMAALLTAVVHVQAHVVNMSLGARASAKSCASCGAVGANRSTVFEYWFKGLAAGASANGSDEPIYACAVGNSGGTAEFDWPAAFADMVAVGSITHAMVQSRFSNAVHKKTGNYILCPGGETDASGNPTEWVGTGMDGTTKTFCTGTSPAAAYASALFILYREHRIVSGRPYHAGAVVDGAINSAENDIIDPGTGAVDPALLRMVLKV